MLAKIRWHSVELFPVYAHKLRPVLFLGALGLFLMVAQVNAGDEIAWNKDLAGKYLDERQQFWFESFSAADRGAGITKTSCLSCHTVVPYALARPVLRKVIGEKEPTKYEKQLLAQIRKRVENWTDLDTPQF